MTQQLFSIRPWHPIMLASVTLALGLSALLASALPARRVGGVLPAWNPWWRYATNEHLFCVQIAK
jgi:hypothetical protein